MSNLPLNIDIQQILLHLLNFVILAGGLYLILYKPVKDFMDSRTEYFRQKDEEAKAAIAKAQETEQEYRDKLAGADAEISVMKARVAKEVAQASKEREEKAAAEAAGLLEKARRQSQEEHDRMLGEAREEIARLAADAARKLAEDQGDEYDRFIQAVGKGDVHEDR